MGAEMEGKCEMRKGIGACLWRQNRHKLFILIQILLFTLYW